MDGSQSGKLHARTPSYKRGRTLAAPRFAITVPALLPRRQMRAAIVCDASIEASMPTSLGVYHGDGDRPLALYEVPARWPASSWCSAT